jgi:GWxTD domain-containing protein
MEDTFTITEPTKSAYYSKLQLLDTFVESNTQTVFSKNGVEQIPLNGFFLDDDKRTINYYAELYQSKLIKKESYPLTQEVFISKKELGYPFQYFEKEDSIIGQDVSLVSGSFNISSLVSGNYYLNVTLEDKYHSILAANSLFFQRVNKHPSNEDSARKFAVDTSIEKINVLNLDKTFTAKFSLQQLKSVLKMLLPVSDAAQTQTIQGFLNKPSELYMRYYIYNYFAAVNPTNPGKAWKEYSNKVIEVNKLFRTGGKPGYETDRGFYYIRYGRPTEEIPVDNEPGALPYEIWLYDVLTQNNQKKKTNAVLLFYKPNPAIDDYILLHCNIGGESQNNNWRSQLYLNSISGNSKNYRIEQYLGK